ncbi:MAG TPA: hypothetical protein VGM19_05240 [Armatimonadota bacterium]|jgi:hypothetical protein
MKLTLRSRRVWILAAVVVLLAAGGAVYFRHARQEAAARQAAAAADQNRVLAEQVAAQAEMTGSVPARTPEGLSEAAFVELSATILIGVAHIRDRGDAAQLVPPLMDKVLADSGVTLEEFEACGRLVNKDPQHSRRVADAILRRVEERGGPALRKQVEGLAAALGIRLKPAKPSAAP